MLIHKEVRKIAKEIAGASYEELAKDNLFHKTYPSQKKFVERHWRNFIGHARQSLVTMLGGDYPEVMKKEIFDIYVKDRSLQALDGYKIQGNA